MESYGTVWVCLDCALHEANGECGGCHDDGHEEEPLSLVAGLDLSMGLSREEHAEDCENRIEGEWRGECDCEEVSFSTSQCEGCGSYMHGQRYAMTLFSQ